MISRFNMNRIKECIYSYRWILVTLCPLALLTNKEIEIAGGLLGIFYFLHQQKLAEAQFFQQNFKDFNQRYDQLNDFLLHAISNHSVPDEKDRFIDYFNLCAEEFLLYQKGYIPNNVWSSWVNGMAFYWKDDEVKKLWFNENIDSYYGFNLKKEIEGL